MLHRIHPKGLGTLARCIHAAPESTLLPSLGNAETVSHVLSAREGTCYRKSCGLLGYWCFLAHEAGACDEKTPEPAVWGLSTGLNARLRSSCRVVCVAFVKARWFWPSRTDPFHGYLG